MPDPQMAEACVQVLQGLPEAYVAADAREFVQSRFRQHLIPEIAAWIARLNAAGVACWVVSGSNRWVVAAGAEMVGIPAERVLALSVVVRDGLLTGEIERIQLRLVQEKPRPSARDCQRCRRCASVTPARTSRCCVWLRGLLSQSVSDATLLAEATSRGWAVPTANHAGSIVNRCRITIPRAEFGKLNRHDQSDMKT